MDIVYIYSLYLLSIYMVYIDRYLQINITVAVAAAVAAVAGEGVGKNKKLKKYMTHSNSYTICTFFIFISKSCCINKICFTFS
jgi:hypothetical protein